MRTIVDIPPHDIGVLDSLARHKNASRTELIRQAVQLFIEKNTNLPTLEEMFGLWKDRKEIGDGVEYQRKMRSEWENK